MPECQRACARRSGDRGATCPWWRCGWNVPRAMGTSMPAPISGKAFHERRLAFPPGDGPVRSRDVLFGIGHASTSVAVAAAGIRDSVVDALERPGVAAVVEGQHEHAVHVVDHHLAIGLPRRDLVELGAPGADGELPDA